MRLSAEKGRLDRTLTGAELQLAEAQRQIQLLEVQPLPTQPWTQPHLECQAVPGVADGSANPGPSSPSTHEPRAGSQRERPFLKWRERRCCRLVSTWAVCPCMLWARRGVSVCGSVVHVA